MRLVLPIPPSVNEMYRHHGHITYKTKIAKDWIKGCLKLVKVKKPYKRSVDLSVHFYFKRDRDIDNSLKALLDLVQKAGIIENDSQVYSMVVTKDFDKLEPRVEIEIMENA
jgi:Holliday junction resolvase RusA-like endonuclease